MPRTRWQPSSPWFARTFKPIKPPCPHPAERLVFQERGGQRHIVCLKCGQVTAKQMIP